MNIQLNNIEKAIMYLDGDLNSKEINEFEKQLFNDSTLVKDFIFIKEIEDKLRDTDIEGFKQSLRKIHMAFIEYEYVENEIDDMKFIIPINRWYYKLYKIAAVIMLILATGFILKMTISHNSTRYNEIFSKYYYPYKSEISVRSSESSLNNFDLALEKYKNCNYNKAVEYFNKIQIQDTTVFFYKGLAYLGNGDLIEALKILSPLAANPGNRYYNQSKWYVSLIWLKLNKPEIAIKHLEWLVKNDSFYGKNAAIILKNLK
jgi:tetratricopeptide (TPR) repeat protein